MESEKIVNFNSLKENVGRFILRDKTFIIPQMNRIGGHLLAATFRGFGIGATVMETFKGLDLGKEYTSGKECYPCQITTGDILYFMQKEKSRLSIQTPTFTLCPKLRGRVVLGCIINTSGLFWIHFLN